MINNNIIFIYIYDNKQNIIYNIVFSVIYNNSRNIFPM